MLTRGQIKLFANRSGEKFANKLSRELNTPISEMKTLDFADGETKVMLKDTVRGCDVFLVQSCFDPTSDRNINQNFMEFLQAGDALKRAGASRLTGILPCHPYCRQDKPHGREPITARLAIDFIEAVGFDNIITSDLHATQIEGFYKKTKVDNLPARNILIDHLKQKYPEFISNFKVIAPDAGGAARSEEYAKLLNSRAAQAFKVRSKTNADVVEKLKIAGLVKDFNILIVDDIISSGGTVEKLVGELKTKEAKNIMMCCTHAFLNDPAIDRIKNANFKLISTDTIPRSEEFKQQHYWYEEVSFASLFAKAISNLNQNRSISELYFS